MQIRLPFYVFLGFEGFVCRRSGKPGAKIPWKKADMPGPYLQLPTGLGLRSGVYQSDCTAVRSLEKDVEEVADDIEARPWQCHSLKATAAKAVVNLTVD